MNRAGVSLHLQFLARIERIVECGVDHVEHAPRIGDTNANSLLQPVDRRNAWPSPGKPIDNVGHLPAKLLSPDLAETGKQRLPVASLRLLRHAWLRK